MKIVFFNVRKDEIDFVYECANKYNIDIEICPYSFNMRNIEYCQGADAISIVTTPVNEDMIRLLHEYGIHYISTRTIGYDHIDLKACQKYDIHVSNVTYSPYSVAEYTIMMMLMSLRKMKSIINRYSQQNFSLQGIRGKELKDLTVGVIGTGNIGSVVIDILKGFQANVIAYDIYHQENINYVTLDELYQQSDIITLHTPLNDDTYHLLNNDSFKLMKNNVMIINTARGALINNKDLINALQHNQIGYVALDVIEDESSIYYRDFTNKTIPNDYLNALKNMSNVLLTPHVAFYSDHSVYDMVENSIISIINMINHNDNPFKII
ncbi:MAG: lactate dehydrogenase [Erysipelotrichaceae bacterium]|nr:lactate dehydrogenase [Erysipelotrichaceae bacterium]